MQEVTGSIPDSFLTQQTNPLITLCFLLPSCREPVPGAGGHHPDQAERTHGGSPQGGRHRQHHHAGGHSLRNELLHRTVDPSQEIQTHHQHLLRSFKGSKSHIPNFLFSSSIKKQNMFTYLQVFAYTFGPNPALVRRGETGPPFPAPPTCRTEEYFCTFCSVVALSLFIVSVFMSDSWMMLRRGWELYELEQRSYSYNRHLFNICTPRYKHVKCRGKEEIRAVCIFLYEKLNFRTES